MKGRLFVGSVRIGGFFIALAAGLFLGIAPALADSINISITIPGSSTPSAPPGGGAQLPPTAYEPLLATAILEGYAHPDSVLTFMHNGTVAGTMKVTGTGQFKRTFTVDAGMSTFGLWARDKNGLMTPTINLTLDLAEAAVARITNIVLAPTIGNERFIKGQALTLYGSAYPRSTVRIFNNNSQFQTPFTTTANADGSWRFVIDRRFVNERAYSYRTNFQIEQLGIISPFSLNLEAKPALCKESDLNGDGRINLTDLSILLYYWGRPLPEFTSGVNECVDRNQDKMIDLRDFSILMYHWGR